MCIVMQENSLGIAWLWAVGFSLLFTAASAASVVVSITDTNYPGGCSNVLVYILFCSRVNALYSSASSTTARKVHVRLLIIL